MIKGLGAALIVGMLGPSLPTRGATAQTGSGTTQTIDQNTVWRQIFKLRGTLNGTKTVDYHDAQLAISSTEQLDAPSLKFRKMYSPFNPSGWQYFSYSGERHAYYDYKETGYDSTGEEYRRYHESGSGTDTNLTQWDAVAVAATQGFPGVPPETFSVGTGGGFSSFSIPTNWTYEIKDQFGIWQTTTGNKTRSSFAIGGKQPLHAPPLSGTKTTGDLHSLAGKTVVNWSVSEEPFLRKIPSIMRHFGWHKGATLQNEWFAGTAMEVGKDFDPHDAPNAPKDTTTITMAWLRTFARVRKAYNQLVNDRLRNYNTKTEITKMLKAKGLLDRHKHSFGNLSAPVPRQDKDYVQRVAISYDIEDLTKIDDLACALGTFLLRLVVAGEVEPGRLPGTHVITVTHYGVYARDSYSFEGFQGLGYWNDDPFYASVVSPDGDPWGDGMPVFNESYRDWRTVHGQGMDFLVFSDLSKHRLDPPMRFHIG